MELTFLGFYIELVYQQLSEHGANMVDIVGGGVDHDVIYISDDILVDQVLEYFINECLEHCRCISESIGHDQVLIVPSCGVESCLPFVLPFLAEQLSQVMVFPWESGVLGGTQALYRCGKAWA